MEEDADSARATEDLPVHVPGGPPPGGLPAPYVEPEDALSADTVGKISHAYVHTDARVDDIAVQLGLTSREVRRTIKRYGLDKRKADIIAQVQQEELAAYSRFLLDHRVDTAEEHLRISQKLNLAAEKLVDRAAGLDGDALTESLKELKGVASLYRSLSETLSASTAVGARAVALNGLTADQAGGLALAGAAGKKPLVSLSFNVSAPAAPARQADVMEAEVVE